MTGGLTQLVAYGAQDVYLTGDPKQTFWKEKFTKYTNFALESIQQDIMGDIGSNRTVSFILKRSGDLVNSIFFQIKMMRGPSGVDDPVPYYSCEQFINNLEVYIGGQKVYEFGHEWFRMYWELFYDYTQAAAYNNMANWGNEQQGYLRTFHLPIPIWFNSFDNGRALPLIALQYHEVEFRIKIADLNNIVGIEPSYVPEFTCYANYTFLDSPERIWFAQTPHEYIIQQVQTNQFPLVVGPTQQQFNLSLNFNHPTKALIWCVTPGSTYHGQYTSEPGEQDAEVLSAIAGAVLLLNGVERFTARTGSYFSNENTWISFGGTYTSSGVYAYGFGTHSDLANPTGTCNFSRIDNATLRIQTKAAVVTDVNVPGNVDTDTMTTVGANILNTVLVFAPNYNVLKIMSGMGGLAYAN
ncbi:major capsid protein VP54 [Acanthocystis turfacea Chlorella virus GM0701.1]|nr:major capsid protein VP54 [Acanthocystis turfacea Chlorella virus GM0701.1]